MSLFTELSIKVIIIVAITDVLEFYIITRNHRVITVLLCIEIIAVTVVPIIIGIWYSLHRHGII